jgi:hypothetical protein
VAVDHTIGDVVHFKVRCVLDLILTLAIRRDRDPFNINSLADRRFLVSVILPIELLRRDRPTLLAEQRAHAPAMVARDRMHADRSITALAATIAASASSVTSCMTSHVSPPPMPT